MSSERPLICSRFLWTRERCAPEFTTAVDYDNRRAAEFIERLRVPLSVIIFALFVWIDSECFSPSTCWVSADVIACPSIDKSNLFRCIVWLTVGCVCPTPASSRLPSSSSTSPILQEDGVIRSGGWSACNRPHAYNLSNEKLSNVYI